MVTTCGVYGFRTEHRAAPALPRALDAAGRQRRHRAADPALLNAERRRTAPCTRCSSHRQCARCPIPVAPCSSSTTSRRSPRSSPATSRARATRRASPATGRGRSSWPASGGPDLVVLDLMLPGLDGLEVMRRLRELGETGPRERVAIILLTAKGEESDRVIGLRLGADDYVVKPFSPAELVARVDAVLRRVDPAPEKAPPLEHGDLVIDPARAARVRARRGGRADPARVRPAAVPRPPPGAGVLARPADGRRLAVRLLLRHVDGHRARAPAARQDRGRSRRSRATCRRCGASATGSSRERAALGAAAERLGAALLAAGAIAAVYGSRDGLVTLALLVALGAPALALAHVARGAPAPARLAPPPARARGRDRRRPARPRGRRRASR